MKIGVDKQVLADVDILKHYAAELNRLITGLPEDLPLRADLRAAYERFEGNYRIHLRVLERDLLVVSEKLTYQNFKEKFQAFTGSLSQHYAHAESWLKDQECSEESLGIRDLFLKILAEVTADTDQKIKCIFAEKRAVVTVTILRIQNDFKIPPGDLYEAGFLYESLLLENIVILIRESRQKISKDNFQEVIFELSDSWPFRQWLIFKREVVGLSVSSILEQLSCFSELGNFRYDCGCLLAKKRISPVRAESLLSDFLILNQNDTDIEKPVFQATSPKFSRALVFMNCCRAVSDDPAELPLDP